MSFRTIAFSGAAVLASAGIATGVAVAPASAAVAVSATHPHHVITVVGKFQKFISHSSFELKGPHHTYVVKTNDMTRITDNGGMKVKLHSIKPGWTLLVKGPDSMRTITAGSIVVEKM